MKKSESLKLTLQIKSSYASSLEAALSTEAEVSRSDDCITVEESEPVFVDMRARWNTVMRGLSAAYDALKAVD
jgi:tRNA threonylcarbamoyladenosine modification (KEOPS) complex  Pcc1 subunit